MSECVLKTLACRGLRVGPSKVATLASFLSELHSITEEQHLMPNVMLAVVLSRHPPRQTKPKRGDSFSGYRSGQVRPRQGTEICNFGAPSPLEVLHWIFSSFSDVALRRPLTTHQMKNLCVFFVFHCVYQGPRKTGNGNVQTIGPLLLRSGFPDTILHYMHGFLQGFCREFRRGFLCGFSVLRFKGRKAPRKPQKTFTQKSMT